MGFRESLIAAYKTEAERHPEKRAEIEVKLKALDPPVSAGEIEQRKQARTGRKVEHATNPPGGRKTPVKDDKE